MDGAVELWIAENFVTELVLNGVLHTVGKLGSEHSKFLTSERVQVETSKLFEVVVLVAAGPSEGIGVLGDAIADQTGGTDVVDECIERHQKTIPSSGDALLG